MRLDRALTSQSWLNLFPMAKLYNLEGFNSDHSPMFLVSKKGDSSRGPGHFRFENAWLLEPMCHHLVNESWEKSEASDIQSNKKACSDKLAVWGKEIMENFSGTIKACKTVLKQLRNKRDPQSLKEYEATNKRLYLTLGQQKVFWRQRSKQLWLRSGDKNIKYFHASANTRRRTNQIHKLKNSKGECKELNNGLEELIISYYTDLFKASQSEWEVVIEYVASSITHE